jgi:hypothetical protein
LKRIFRLVHAEARQRAEEAVRTAPDDWVITVAPPGRSIGQNDLSHALYEEIARKLPEDDALGWKAYCKLHHGVPILRAEDQEYRAVYDGAIKGLNYEQKLQVMRIFPATSVMNKSQISKYLEAVKADFDARGVYLDC